MDAITQSLLAPIQQGRTLSQRLAGLFYLWMEGVRAFKVYESGVLDRPLVADKQERHRKLLTDLIAAGRFFESRAHEIEDGDLEAFGFERSSLLTSMDDLEEWKEILSNG